MRMADIFVAFSILPFERDCSPCNMCPGMRRERNEKKNERTKKNEKEERNAVASPTRNRTLPNAEEEGRSRTRERNYGRTPTMPARTTDLRCYTKPRIRSFAICRQASMCDTVRYDMTRRGCVFRRFGTTLGSPVILQIRG